MTSKTSQNNKRIAKNTLLLYFRMFFIMGISLFTSRIILKTLGVEDFGIYNVVGGVVAMMGVLNTAMASSIQRYLSFEIGKGNLDSFRKTFSVCFFIYVFLCAIFLFFAETIGLWFINNKLVIPNERMFAANIVYQFTIVSVINTLLSNPYNACIISHEKMNVFAYVSIVEVILKLGIVYILYVIPYDRLIIYGMLFMIMSIIVTMIYRIYCLRSFPECHLKWYSDKKLYKQLLSYSGWNLFGSISGMVKGQGLNILLNIFFSPSVNASRGIAYQVNSAVSHFFTNFYTAVRPQITKYYAQGDMENMFKLVFRSSKLSCFLILLISLPILIETPFIIRLWLGQLPEYVVVFVRLIIAITAIDAMANPLMTAAHATGRIAVYQSTVGTMTILNIPISYIFLSYGHSPIVVFVVSLVISIVCLFMRLWIVRWLMAFPVLSYIRDVFLKALIVTFFAVAVPLLLYNNTEDSSLSAVFICSICVVCTIISVFFFGLNSNEKTFIINTIKNKIK